MKCVLCNLYEYCYDPESVWLHCKLWDEVLFCHFLHVTSRMLGTIIRLSRYISLEYNLTERDLIFTLQVELGDDDQQEDFKIRLNSGTIILQNISLSFNWQECSQSLWKCWQLSLHVDWQSTVSWTSCSSL
jgi:hypothetical protein